jgi:hypothetical protein
MPDWFTSRRFERVMPALTNNLADELGPKGINVAIFMMSQQRKQ